MADDNEEVTTSPDPQFEPIITLSPVETKTLEEDEDELLRLRAKLFRFENKSEPREWKERGTGDVKFLKHREKGHIRLLMRRDKTLKICANHFILPQMKLRPNCSSDRAWIWSTPADYTDEEPKAELLAIRFANVENAQKFKTKFEEIQIIMKDLLKEEENGESTEESDKLSEPEKHETETNAKEVKSEDSVTEKLGGLSVKDKSETVTTNGGTGDGTEKKPDETEKKPDETEKKPDSKSENTSTETEPAKV